MIMPRIEEAKKDLAEYKVLHEQATRELVKDVLSIEIRKLETEIKQLEDSNEKSGQVEDLSEKPSQVPVNKPKPQICSVKIVNYAWDQSDKFVKFYITLKNAHNLPPENVITKFTPKSIELQVNNLDDKSYSLTVNNLLQRIIPSESKHKVKTDKVVVFMKKESEVSWSYVTEAERKAKETKTPKLDENEDPGQSLMNLMKQMYDEGDDEMKRTIAKSWMEAREKQGSGF